MTVIWQTLWRWSVLAAGIYLPLPTLIGILPDRDMPDLALAAAIGWALAVTGIAHRTILRPAATRPSHGTRGQPQVTSATTAAARPAPAPRTRPTTPRAA